MSSCSYRIMFLKWSCIHFINSSFLKCRFEVNGELRVLKRVWYRPGLVVNTSEFINCWMILSRSDSNRGDLWLVDIFATLDCSSNTQHTELSSPPYCFTVQVRELVTEGSLNRSIKMLHVEVSSHVSSLLTSCIYKPRPFQLFS